MGIRERREREREQRRLAILASARDAFAKHGLENTSMERIADEAELAKGTLYLYYKTRDELLIGVILQDLEQLLTKIERVASSKLPADKKLMRAFTTFHAFAKDRPIFHKVTTQFDIGHLVGCRDEQALPTALHFRHLNDRMFEAIVGMVQQGVDEGLFFLDRPIRQVVFQLMITMKGAMMVAEGGLHPPQWAPINTNQVLRDTATLLLRGLRYRDKD